MKRFLGMFFLCVSCMVSAQTQQISCEELFEPIMMAIQNNDAEIFSKYFAEVLNCDVMGEEHMYTKVQATQIVKDFFMRTPVKQLSIKHCSGKQYLKYAIGYFTSVQGAPFRITIFVNTKDTKIQQLKIEKQN